MTPDRRKNFLLKHSLLHIGKTSAKIAAVCEDFDHRGCAGPDDEASVKTAAVKMFVNALKLAEEAGVSADELLAEAPRHVS